VFYFGRPICDIRPTAMPVDVPGRPSVLAEIIERRKNNLATQSNKITRKRLSSEFIVYRMYTIRFARQTKNYNVSNTNAIPSGDTSARVDDCEGVVGGKRRGGRWIRFRFLHERSPYTVGLRIRKK